MSLKDARREAQRLRAQHEQGHDPQIVRLLEKQTTLKADSVEMNARQPQPDEIPDLMSAFKRAAKPDAGREQESGAVGLDHACPRNQSPPEGPDRSR